MNDDDDRQSASYYVIMILSTHTHTGVRSVYQHLIYHVSCFAPMSVCVCVFALDCVMQYHHHHHHHNKQLDAAAVICVLPTELQEEAGGRGARKPEI